MLLTILRDNREQKPWAFSDQPASVSDATISTGDYTLAEFCEHDDELDTYQPNFAIERKSGPDFISSITADRQRFRSELERAAEWEEPMPVLIEHPMTTFKRGLDFMKYRNVSWASVKGTVDSWQRHYNVEFIFTGGRQEAQRRAFELLSSHLLNELLP